MLARIGKGKWLLLLLAAGAVVVAALSARRWRGGEDRPGPTAGSALEDPRLTFATPFRNVRPDVNYVGDTRCIDCHADIAASYRRHSMGRSFLPVRDVAGRQAYGTEVHNPFVALDRTFQVERRGNVIVQRQVRYDLAGGTVYDRQDEIAYVIGSGSHGHSYMIDRDGWLLQSPVSWFSQKQIWDLSPGFSQRHMGGRPVVVSCLFCHCNHAANVPHTTNRYRDFRPQPIGCERCHGPGELHVKRRESAEVIDGIDDSIVNPKHLEPALREAVCEQCHLEGKERVLRRGRDTFDFRPGLPLYPFWSVFVKAAGEEGQYDAVTHVEHMHLSRCYRASGGRLGCGSCHDSHALPAPEEKASYYRDRCLGCHGQQACSETAQRRQEQGDSCTACHMPRSPAADIAHTASTDHRILRRPVPPGPRREIRLDPGVVPLRYYFDGVPEEMAAEIDRDLGVALINLARSAPLAQQPLARMALPKLEAAVARAPDDLAALEAKGFALWAEERRVEALEAFEAVLRQAPQREGALVDAAAVAEDLGRYDQAIAYWERARAANPTLTGVLHELARLCARRARIEQAIQACEAALERDPGHTGTRQLLVACLMRRGDTDRARAEFDKLLALRPRDAPQLQAWFADLQRPAPRP